MARCTRGECVARASVCLIHFGQRAIGLCAVGIERDRLLHLLHRQLRVSLHGLHPGHRNVRRSEIRIELQGLRRRLLRHVEQVGITAVAVLQEVRLTQPGLRQGKIRICLKHFLKAADCCGNVGLVVIVLQLVLRL